MTFACLLFILLHLGLSLSENSKLHSQLIAQANGSDSSEDNKTGTSVTETTVSHDDDIVRSGRCHVQDDCLDIEFEKDDNDSNVSCCNANGEELPGNVSNKVEGYCCYNGSILVPTRKTNKLLTILILGVSIISCIAGIGYLLVRLNLKYNPNEPKGGFNNLVFSPDRAPTKKSSVTLPVERPYISCPLIDESGNDSSEEEKVTSSLAGNQETRRLVFEMIQEDFKDSFGQDDYGNPGLDQNGALDGRGDLQKINSGKEKQSDA